MSAVLVFAAVVAAFFALAMLSGCAYIAGPCSLSLGEMREAICEAGGVMILMPSPKEPLLQQVSPAAGARYSAGSP